MDLVELKRASPRLLGRGKFAKVYALDGLRLPDAPYDLAFKKYHRSIPPISTVAMQSLVGVRSKMPARQRARLDGLATWPLEVVTDSGQTVGILMRLIPSTFFFEARNYHGNKERLAFAATYLTQDEEYCRTWGIPIASGAQRLEFLRELAYALAFLHKADIVYGDLSANNVLCSLEQGQTGAMLVDCDSALLVGTAPIFGKQPHSPGYEPPEAELAKRQLSALVKRGRFEEHERAALHSAVYRQSVQTDVYKFGLLCLRILNPGRNVAFAGLEPRMIGSLPARIRPLLLSSLDDDSAHRPAMRDWVEALAGAEPGKGSGVSPNGIAGFVRQTDGSWARR